MNTRPLLGRRIIATGRVQGLGVRPTIARLARRLDLAGSVANTPEGLAIELFGTAEQIERFLVSWHKCLPTGTVIDKITVEPCSVKVLAGFDIMQHNQVGASSATVPLDVVVCDRCLAEISNPLDRRYRYAFTSCAQCGPRYSIVQEMPFDRSATSMSKFRNCTPCQTEFSDFADRRCHAQTIACTHCGPRMWLADRHGRQVAAHENAISMAGKAIADGQIVAMKGVGGYQLIVDATSAVAVARLRQRKGRETKALAVMVDNFRFAETLAFINAAEKEELTSPAGPIVIVSRRTGATLAPNVCPQTPTYGLMLPNSPQHALLLEQVGQPVIVTSGNHDSGVMAFDNQTATEQLAGIADVWLHHDRVIERPIDDSVVRVVRGQTIVLRLARGMAPLRLAQPSGDLAMIALGGQQKNAIAVTNGFQTILGPHVGTLDNIENCDRWQHQLEHLAKLYGVSLNDCEFVCDAHPDYFSSRLSEKSISVYHHHAHVATVMHEHGLDQPVIGLAWDGTGLGPDGTIWGGEALVADRTSFRRVASLRPFALVGGDTAIREPWRVATVLVAEAIGPDEAGTLPWPNAKLIIQSLQHPRLHTFTSSVGRLFDGIAALVLGLHFAGEEGEAAVQLEYAAERQADGAYALEWNCATEHADWRPMIRQVVTDIRRGLSSGVIAMRFHRAMANWAISISKEFAELPMVVSGGCFQNGLLRELLDEQLASRDQGYFHSVVVPPGDGGLAVGQLAVAAARRK